MHQEFQVHKLNTIGLGKAAEVAVLFDRLLTDLERVLDRTDGRYLAIVRTKLEEACFFAKKALAVNPNNQQGEAHP